MNKVLLFLVTLLITAAAWAQVPQQISYQSVIRDGNNVVVASSPVGIKISLLQGTAAGTAVYVETHSKTTNANGLVSLEIGTGTVLSGSFASIDWANGPYLVKTETDPTGGTNYSVPGVFALNSVPYALYAANGTPGPKGDKGDTGATGATGPTGAKGDTGATGLTGPTGAAGATGASGANGTTGADGKTVRNGTSNPVSGTGVDGDFYINTATNTLFGPKANGAWPSGVALVGPTGATGAQGIQGPTGATGAAGPAPSGTGLVTVTNGSLQTPGALTGDVTTSGGGLATTIGASKVVSSMIADGTIVVGDLANDAVETAKIKDANVTDAKIATGIDAAKLADGSVSNAELQYINSLTSNAQTQITTNATSASTNATNIATNATNIATNATDITALETLAVGKIYLGNVSNVATEVTISGDVTIDNVGATTIGASKVTNSMLAGSIDLTSKVTGALPVANGGTGTTTLTANNVLVGNGTSALQSVAPGTNGNVLTSDGTTWTSVPPAAGLPSSGNIAGDMLYWNGSAWVKVSAGSNGQTLSFYNGAPVWTGTISNANTVVNSTTGKTWMDRNLGASQVATSSTDSPAYGDLYQWGRGTDGHQIRTSGTTATLSSTDQPGNGNFILAPNSPYDWRSPRNDNLWQGVAGVNNPCPTGYRIPTETEWNAERQSWTGGNNAAGAFASPLKLPMAGSRFDNDGSLFLVGADGVYWSSTVSYTDTRVLNFNSSIANMYTFFRARGLSVRCLKD
uniref:hypothetical protein n=1 Tax=Algoriphagus sp. TaxID=1872435 RepID=UPI0040476453